VCGGRIGGTYLCKRDMLDIPVYTKLLGRSFRKSHQFHKNIMRDWVSVCIGVGGTSSDQKNCKPFPYIPPHHVSRSRLTPNRLYYAELVRHQRGLVYEQRRGKDIPTRLPTHISMARKEHCCGSRPSIQQGGSMQC